MPNSTAFSRTRGIIWHFLCPHAIYRPDHISGVSLVGSLQLHTPRLQRTVAAATVAAAIAAKEGPRESPATQFSAFPASKLS